MKHKTPPAATGGVWKVIGDDDHISIYRPRPRNATRNVQAVPVQEVQQRGQTPPLPVASLPVFGLSSEARREGVGHPDEIVQGQAAGLLLHAQDRGRRTHPGRADGLVLEALRAAVPRSPQGHRRRGRIRHPVGVRPARPAARPPDRHHGLEMVGVEDEGRGAGLVGLVMLWTPGEGLLRPGEQPRRPRPLRHQEPSGSSGSAAAPG